jgi:hypothetical protein
VVFFRTQQLFWFEFLSVILSCGRPSCGAVVAAAYFLCPHLFLHRCIGVRRRIASMGPRERPVSLVALSLLALACLALACLLSEAVVWRLLWDLVLRVLASLLSAAASLGLVALMSLAL